MPAKKPLVWAPNHCNAFIDPTLVAMAVPRKVRFFARGDVFKGRFVKWAFNSMSMSPMFRLQEGYGELKKNDKTFEECRNLLSNNKTLLMFPEAICVQERRLRPLKKGLSRIIFQTEELFDFKKDVCVMPVGLNYSHPSKFRSKVFMEIGNPISIKKYEQRYKQDKVKAINEFTKELEQEMTKLLVIIKNPGNDKLVEGIEEIYIQQLLKKKHQNEKSLEKQYHASKEIAGMVNYLAVHHPKLIASLHEKIKLYLSQLKKYNLRDHLLRPSALEKKNFGKFILEVMVLLAGLPVYALGLVMNFPPYFIARKICDRKIKKVEFYASVYANLAMILWLIYYPLQLLTVALVFRSWTFLCIYAIVVPAAAQFVLTFYPLMKKIIGRWRLMKMQHSAPHAVEKLVNERFAIIEEIETAQKEYAASIH